MANKFTIFAIALTLLVIKLSMSSFSGGVSGGATASGCSCHGSATANTMVTITGLPTNYINGTTYTLTLNVTNSMVAASPTKKAGFTLASPDTLGAIMGAGTTLSANKKELIHSSPKNMVSNVSSWQFTWKAPATGSATSTFSIAANAVNGNSSNSGDMFNYVTIAVPGTVTPLSITASNTTINCNGGVASITVVGAGGTGALSYNINGGMYQAGGTFTNRAAGTYTITVRDANLVTASTVRTIMQPSAITTSISSQTNVSCNGLSNGATTIMATGGTGVYTYSWLPSSGTSATATGLAAGIYTATITDGNNCTKTETVTITQPTPITASITASSTAVTSGSTITLTVMPSTFTTYNVIAPSGLNVTNPTNVIALPINSSNAGTFTVTATNAAGCTATTTINIAISNLITIQLKAMLAGPYISSTGLMQDSLRILNYLPLTEPYSTSPYATVFDHVNGGGGETTTPAVLSVAGNDAIVDWVFVQLRNKLDSTQVLATRSALIQCDGDIVDIDGISPLSFTTLAIDDYFISLKHRNHLGIMTRNKINLTNATPPIDFTITGAGAVPLLTYAGKAGNATPLTGATAIVNGMRMLYGGNCNIAINGKANRFISYGSFNSSDRNALLIATQNGFTPTVGYSVFDCDLNGSTRFNGINPDRFVITNSTLNTNSIIVNEQTPN